MGRSLHPGVHRRFPPRGRHARSQRPATGPLQPQPGRAPGLCLGKRRKPRAGRNGLRPRHAAPSTGRAPHVHGRPCPAPPAHRRRAEGAGGTRTSLPSLAGADKPGHRRSFPCRTGWSARGGMRRSPPAMPSATRPARYGRVAPYGAQGTGACSLYRQRRSARRAGRRSSALLRLFPPAFRAGDQSAH